MRSPVVVKIPNRQLAEYHDTGLLASNVPFEPHRRSSKSTSHRFALRCIASTVERTGILPKILHAVFSPASSRRTSLSSWLNAASLLVTPEGSDRLSRVRHHRPCKFASVPQDPNGTNFLGRKCRTTLITLCSYFSEHVLRCCFKHLRRLNGTYRMRPYCTGEAYRNGLFRYLFKVVRVIAQRSTFLHRYAQITEKLSLNIDASMYSNQVVMYCYVARSESYVR